MPGPFGRGLKVPVDHVSELVGLPFMDAWKKAMSSVILVSSISSDSLTAVG